MAAAITAAITALALGSASQHPASDFATPASLAATITALALGSASTHASTDFARPAISTTWANQAVAIAAIAAGLGTGFVFVSDVGISGVSAWCNGTKLILPAPIIVLQKAKGWIMPSLVAGNLATYTQSGTTLTVVSPAHTMTSALNGCDVFLIMGAVITGVMPTAPVYAGWFTNFTYIDGNTFRCTAGNSQLATGNVNSNTAETIVTELSTVIPGNLMGLNGDLESYTVVSGTSSANLKRVYGKLSGLYFKNSVLSGAGNVAMASRNRIANRNSLTSQIGSSAYNYTEGFNTNVNTALAINTVNDQTLQHSLIASAANEYVCLEEISVRVIST